jgi:hypothetical protein
VKCSACGKPSFVGCGRHVEQVLGDVPIDSRCKCREEKRTDGGSVASFFDRLLGR